MNKIAKPEKIGNKIRALRVSSGMTQEALGKEVGYSESTISRIENGYGSQNLEVLSSLASALNTTLDNLVEEESGMKKEDAANTNEHKNDCYYNSNYEPASEYKDELYDDICVPIEHKDERYDDLCVLENEYKIKWYDAICELEQMGFDLDHNTARDLIGAANELIRIHKE